MINKVKKLWGNEEWLVNTDLYCAKFLNLQKGFACSYHYHKIKDETFYVLKGEVLLEIEGSKVIYRKGEQVRIKPGIKHRFTAVTKTAKILEISTTHYDEDSYRIENAKKL